MRHQFAERLLDLGAQHSGRVDELVEEQGAVALHGVQHGLGPAAEPRRLRLRREQCPEPDAPPVDEGDRRRGHGRNGARPVAGAGCGREPRPGDPARLTLCVEPRRLVALEAGRQDLRLPRPRRRFEPFQHRQRPRQRVRPFEPRVVVDMLPVEQKAEEIARRDRLDLGPQTVDGAPVHAGDQSPVAPLLVIDARVEAATQDCAVRFERGKRGGDRRRLEAERSGQRGGRDGARPLQPAAQDGDARLFGGPGLAGAVRLRSDVGL